MTSPANEWTVLLGKPSDPPSTSWWLDLTWEQFSAQAAQELGRMRGSREAAFVRPITVAHLKGVGR